ncbi:MAG TPA: C4-type zinc ribbon domain-containing protein [Saprospiraceae bacterium]|nr:C4-type zinc ribbon domain-containing protein [Saprospiraceae bacterium]
MANKELTIPEQLAQLYHLQKNDSKLDEIKVMKGELPMEVSDFEDDLVGLNTRKSRLLDSINDIDEDIKNHNNNIKESESLIVKYEKQLDKVKNNREFDALNKEIELQRLEIQLSEKRIKEANVSKVAKGESLKNIEDKIAVRQKELKVKKDELESIIEKTEKEEDRLIKDSTKQRKEIEPRLLKAYDKIRSSYRNGLAVAVVARESCGGCFNKIPPQKQIEIGMMKHIVACEHCGRILVDDTFILQEA